MVSVVGDDQYIVLIAKETGKSSVACHLAGARKGTFRWERPDGFAQAAATLLQTFSDSVPFHLLSSGKPRWKVARQPAVELLAGLVDETHYVGRLVKSDDRGNDMLGYMDLGTAENSIRLSVRDPELLAFAVDLTPWDAETWEQWLGNDTPHIVSSLCDGAPAFVDVNKGMIIPLKRGNSGFYIFAVQKQTGRFEQCGVPRAIGVIIERRDDDRVTFRRPRRRSDLPTIVYDSDVLGCFLRV